MTGKDLEILEDMVSRMSNPNNPKTESDYMSITAEQLRNSASLPNIPYVVITSGDRSKAVPPIFSKEARKKLVKLGEEVQKGLVNLIPEGIHIIAKVIGHNIHLEKPEALLAPLVEMIDEVRKRKKKYQERKHLPSTLQRSLS